MSYWALTVITNLMTVIPVVGQDVLTSDVSIGSTYKAHATYSVYLPPMCNERVVCCYVICATHDAVHYVC